MDAAVTTESMAVPTDVWQPVFDASVGASRRGQPEQGQLACEWLLSLPDLPEAYAERTRRHQASFAPLLSGLAPGARFVELAVPVRPGWSCFNPSIAATVDGFRCVVRSSNYVLHPDRYELLDPGGVVRTVNSIADLGPDLGLRTVAEIGDRTDRRRLSDFPVDGFEDCRLFFWQGAWRATATARNRNPDGICQQVLLTLDDGAWTDLVKLSDWRTGVHEKNWMPLVEGAALRFVRTCHPTRVVAYDPGRRTVVPMAKRRAPAIARHFRGGGQAVAVAEGWLLIVHELVAFDDGRRVYPHRFVLLDHGDRLAMVSPPFFFRDRQVEYAAGLALRDGRVVVSAGDRDRTAFLVSVPLDEVLATLAPPLDPSVFTPALLGKPTAGGWANGDASGRPRRVASPAADSASGSVVLPASDPGLVAGFTPFPPPDPGRIVSTTLAGDAADLIGDALRSVVDWVDACLLIDTGIADGTLEAARAAAGDKLVVRSFPWRDDFAAARNAALAFAADLGAAWAVTLDTDERIATNGLDVRAALAATSADLLHVRQADGSYAKERFVRLPTTGMFVGPTHEAFAGARQVEELPDIRFDEVPKPAEAYRRKFERDAAILARHTLEHPDDPRWFYYLGDALQNLGRHDEAIAAYRACWDLDGWDEEGAWAMYRAAECHIALGDNRAAIRACADGLVRHPGIAELPWLAGFAAWGLGDFRKAVAWSSMSVALGSYEGVGEAIPRVGFTNPRARWEGPFDVLRFALRALGDDAAADEAEAAFADAREARLARLGDAD